MSATDPTDERILRELTPNARITNGELSASLSVWCTPHALWLQVPYRVADLDRVI